MKGKIVLNAIIFNNIFSFIIVFIGFGLSSMFNALNEKLNGESFWHSFINDFSEMFLYKVLVAIFVGFMLTIYSIIRYK